jgi:hypothetical protein
MPMQCPCAAQLGHGCPFENVKDVAVPQIILYPYSDVLITAGLVKISNSFYVLILRIGVYMERRWDSTCCNRFKLRLTDAGHYTSSLVRNYD